MSVISLTKALAHLRVDEDIDGDIASKLASAEATAMQYMNRNFYVDKTALDQALLTVSDLQNQAQIKLDQAKTFSQSLSGVIRQNYEHIANIAFDEAINEINKILLGIVINEAIEIGVLLILGDLFENRENSITTGTFSEMPKGAIWHLDKYRTQLGV